MNPKKFNFLLGSAFLIALMTTAVYGASITNGFSIIDDGLLIYENNLLREITPQTLRIIFTSYDPELYIPLTFLSYQIDYLIAGYQPFIYHITNMLLHMVSSMLVAVCGYFILRDRKSALLCGILFAVHPLHVEAVAWASARKDVLSGVLFLGSIVSYFFWTRAMEKGNGKRETFLPLSPFPLPLALSFILFLLALLAKVTAATLPLILILIDWYRGRDLKSLRVWIEKIPFFLLSFVFGIVALGGKSALFDDTTILQKVLMSCKMTAFALWKILVPVDLSVFYPELSAISITTSSFFFSMLIFLTLAFLVIKFRHIRIIPFSALFFLITLSPSFFTTVKGGGIFFFSDRYGYIPSIGLVLLVVFLMSNWQLPIGKARKLTANMPIACVVLLIITLTFTAQLQTSLWGDSVKLFTRVTDLYPGYYLGHINRGATLRVAGRSDEAIQSFRDAIALHPIANTYGLIGQVHAEQGNYADAIRLFQEGIALNPEEAELHYGLGQVYAFMGESEKALMAYQNALDLSPVEKDVYRSFSRRISSRRDRTLLRMGMLEGQRGNHETALDYYKQAIEENPYSADIHYNLAVSLGNLKRMDDALVHYERAVELDPQYLVARMNLAFLYLHFGRESEAFKEFSAVLKIDPENSVAKKGLRSITAPPPLSHSQSHLGKFRTL